MKDQLTVAEVSELTGLTKKAVARRIEKGKVQALRTTPGKPRLISKAEVEKLQQHLATRGIVQPPKTPRFSIVDDEAVVTSSVNADLANPDSLLAERGLNPAEWEITHLKVNEWDGPSGEPLKQLTVNVKRKVGSAIFQPAFVPDDYVKPDVTKPGKLREDGELVVLVGDQQAPYHDQNLHRLFLSWLTENEPERGILMGDTVDLPDISRHPQNPEHDVPVQDCINAGYQVLKDYVQSSLSTKWVKLMGNHDERIRARLVNYMTGLYGLRIADEPGQDPEPSVFSIEHLMRLKALGIDYIDPQGPYAHAQYKLSKHLAARHGWIAKKGSGASALGTLEHLGYSVVVGHTHRQGLVHQTKHDIDGTTATLAAAETGCMCRFDLGYTVAPDWQQGFATAMIYPDGTFKLDLATYVNDVLYWRDQRFD